MSPSYQTNDPKGWCGDPARGAALGRASIRPPRDEPPKGKLTLRKVRIDNGGYDSNGTYFGIGSPLYWCADDAGTLDVTIRASDREDAKAQVREMLQPFVCAFHR